MSYVDTITFFSFQQVVDYVTILAGSRQYLADGSENPNWMNYYQEVLENTKWNYHYKFTIFIMIIPFSVF